MTRQSTRAGKRAARARVKGQKKTLKRIPELVAAPRASVAVARSSDPDSKLLLLGGIALMVLVVGDALFVLLSSRLLRETAEL